MSDDKEKIQVYTDPEVARAMRMESARLGITQGELFVEMWEAYQKKDQLVESESKAQVIEVKAAEIEELKRKKQDQTERETRELRIAKAREILDDWSVFDIDMIELYARRMNELGEKKLAQELHELAEYKRRTL